MAKGALVFIVAIAIYLAIVLLFELSPVVSFLGGTIWGSVVMNVILWKWELYYFEWL